MQAYQPAWWLPNGHCQTLWAALLRRTPGVTTRHEHLELPDGDFLDLRWTPGSAGPIVIVLHGLEGCIESTYIQGILSALEHRGWRGVLMHFRNCGKTPNRLPQSYHAGATSDLAYLVDLLKEREPHTLLAVLGYSLGGNVLLKWLGETKKAPVKAAVAVSVPFELEKAMSRLERGFSRLYHWHFLRLLRRSARRKFETLPPPHPPASIRAMQSIREFDDKITAPLHGFRNVHHYYSVSSCRQYLKNITVPTLLIHAQDDPFMSPEAIPEPEEISIQTEMEIFEKGGHVGFITGNWPWRSCSWLEKRIPQFFSKYLEGPPSHVRGSDSVKTEAKRNYPNSIFDGWNKTQG
ncbi:MAG: hydrolase [SAR324 cluster bacterium]|nr:hydrolase [SAR324 cluster bacterium]